MGRTLDFTHKLTEAYLPLLRYCRALCRGNADDAQDLAQQVCERAWADRQNYQEKGKIENWLKDMAINTRRANFRKTRREVADPEGKIAEALLFTDVNPEDDLLGKQFVEKYDAFVTALPSQQREALTLFHAGYTYEEIGASLNKGTSSARKQVQKVSRRLRQALVDFDVPQRPQADQSGEPRSYDQPKLA